MFRTEINNRRLAVANNLCETLLLPGFVVDEDDVRAGGASGLRHAQRVWANMAWAGQSWLAQRSTRPSSRPN